METAIALKVWRHRNKKTQEELAELLGVSTAAVTSWERDEKQPSQANKIKIEEITGLKFTLE